MRQRVAALVVVWSVVAATTSGLSEGSSLAESEIQASVEATADASVDPMTKAYLETSGIDLGGGRTVPDVEMASLRGERSKVYSTEIEGVWRTVVTEEPAHFATATGWEPIDEAFHELPRGGFSNGANAFDVVVGPTADELLSLSLSDGSSISYVLAGASEAAPVRVDERTVRFDGVLADTSVELQSAPSGVKELLVLDSAGAPDTFRFPLSVQGLTPRVGADGAVEFLDGSGVVQAYVPRGWMQDSSTNPDTGLPATSDDVTYEIVAEGANTEMVVRVDRRWLDDPSRVYPVIVDPTTVIGPVSSGRNDDTRIVALGSSSHQHETYLNVGYSVLNQRSFLKFELSTMGGSTTNTLDSKLTFVHESGSCVANEPVQVRPLDADWPDGDSDGVYMEDGDWSWTTSHMGTPITVSESCPQEGGVDKFVIEGAGLDALVDVWIDGGTANHGFGMVPYTEGTSAPFKKLTSSEGATVANRPKLEITWTYEPVHRKVDGGAGTSTEFTSFSGGVDCYPESTAPSAWAVNCKMDLYWKSSTPPTSDTKTVVLVHGGGWAADYSSPASGIYEGRRYGADMQRTADAFAEEGFLVALIDYRQGMRTYQGVPNIVNGGILRFFADWFHCTQRWEKDDASPFKWPPDDQWIPDAGKPDPPSLECDYLDNGAAPPDPAPEQFDDVISGSGTPGDDNDGAVMDAVNDVQAAVAWLDGQRNAATQFAGVDIDPGKIFLVGASAGAFTVLMANFEADSTNAQAVDGVVAMAGTHMIDAAGATMLKIDDAERTDGDGTRDLLSTAKPVQLQQWEYDFGGVGVNNYRAGNFDFARQTYRFLRDADYKVELRTRCGPGHIPSTSSVHSFNYAFGEARDFLNNLDAGVNPTEGFWYGASGAYQHFVKEIGQDSIEDQFNVKYGFNQPGDGTPDKVHPVGDFNGDGHDDIFWYGGDWFGTSLCDTFWYSQVDTSGPSYERASFARTDAYFDDADDSGGDDYDNVFTSGVIRDVYDNSPAIAPETQSPTAFAVGDFDGDNIDDLFWFRADTNSDAIWYGKSDPYTKDKTKTGSFCRNVTNVCNEVDQDGTFDQLAVGDFNGDGYDDIYFDETGTGDDEVWYGSATKGSFTAATISNDPDGTYDLLVGNFDGDLNTTPDPDVAIDDLYFSSASGSGDQVFYGRTGTTGDRFDEQPLDNTFGYEIARVGRFDNNAQDDIFFYDEGSSTDKMFYGSSSRTTRFTQQNETNSLSGAYKIARGDFNGDGYHDLYFQSATGNEWLYRAKSGYGSGQGFDHHNVGNAVAGDRAAIVGEFGPPPGDTTVRDDIFWHFTGDRSYKPASDWPWCPCGL